VLDKAAQTIEIRDLENSITKTIKCPVQTTDIFFGGTSCLLLSGPAAVVLFDIQQQRVVAELATPAVKYAVWSNDNNMVALLSKHSTSFFRRFHSSSCLYLLSFDATAIMIANKNLGQSAMVHETIRIKSGAWDDSGVFIYSTLNHIKYALPQGFVCCF
jgi:coatomer protein complex subunit alpha (xenin)